jgi:glycerophosphoryl diester phosphodiesterase
VRLAYVLVVTAACSSPRQPPTPAVTRPRIVAHRGASFDAPENTQAAFRRAWELGVECVELDVRLSRDGEAVVIHDATTKRTAGGEDRPVAEQTLAELRALDAGAWKGAAFAGERIPTIGEVLSTTPSGRSVFVEIKSGVETVPAVAKAILAADPRPRGVSLALQGYNPLALDALAKALPGVPAYWTVDPPTAGDRPLPYPPELPAAATQFGFAGVALDHGFVGDELVAQLRAAGLHVDVWTVNDAAAIAAWYARDIRWIETDRPDLAPAR